MAKVTPNPGNSHAGANDEEKLIDLDKAWSIIKKNWIVLKSDRARLIAMFTFPVLMILIYGSTTGVSTKGINAAVVDYDHSNYSSQFITDLYSTQTFTSSQLLGSEDQAKIELETGEVKTVFVIPAGFEQSYDSGNPMQITVMIDESDPSTAVTEPESQALVARFSAQLGQELLAQAYLNESRANAQLSGVRTMLSSAASTDFTQVQSSTTASFAQSNGLAQAAQQSLSAQELVEENQIGNPINPNLLLGFNPSAPSSSGTGFVLSQVTAQQAAIGQAEYYAALNAQVQALRGDSASIYSNYAYLYSVAQADKARLGIALLAINSAQGQIGSASAQSQAALLPVSVNFYNPFGSGRNELDFLLANILALVIFQGAAAGLGRAIAGERQNGSLTRVFLTPTSSTTIILGTQLFYLIVECARSLLLVMIAVFLFSVTISGSIIDFLFIIMLYAIGATGVGMVLSVMAKNQEQYQALSLLVIVPTIFLSGVFFPIQTLPGFLQSVAEILPMSYAADALSSIMVKGFGLAQVWPDIAFLVGFGALTVAASIMLFQRELV